MKYKFKPGDKVRFRQPYLTNFPIGMKATIREYYKDWVDRPCYLIEESMIYFIDEDVLELDGPRPKKGFGQFIERIERFNEVEGLFIESKGL